MRLGAGGDLSEHAGQGLGELAVGVMPELASGRVQVDFASGLGVLESCCEQFGEAGAVEGVVVAAFGQEALAAAGDDQDAVQIAVGELDRGRVATQLVLGDVADQRDVRACGARRRCAGQDRERPTIPGGAQRRRQGRDLAGRCLEDASELRLDHE